MAKFKPKFNVGDKVVVTATAENSTGTSVGEFYFTGDVGRIVEVDCEIDTFGYRVVFDKRDNVEVIHEGRWWCDEADIELFVEDTPDKSVNQIDSHYNFYYTLTEKDIAEGKIKTDPYFIANQWKLGEKDNSGVIFHIMKTCARFSEKNPIDREIKAIHKQIKRLAELHNVELEG